MKISYPVGGIGRRASGALGPLGCFDGLGRALTGLLVAVAVPFAAGCKDSPKAIPPAPVKVGPVIERDVPIYREWIGTTVGYISAQIRARVSGYLVSQNYREGTLVKTGDLLFQIDPRPYQNAADQARAQLRLAESQLEEAKAQVAQAEADVAKAEATQKKTELEVARYTPLAARGSISQQELDNTVQNNLANLAAVQAARASVAKAQAGVAKAQAEIAQAQPALNEALLNLGWTKIFSPIDGIAGIKKADIGDLISNTTVLTTVATIDPIYVQFNPTEQEYLRWREAHPGAPARRGQLELILADGQTYPHLGTGEILGLEVDATTGTIAIRASFPNPANLLRPGQYAKVRVPIAVRKGALLVPQRAIRDTQGLLQVGLVGADNTVSLRSVQVGERVGSLSIIERGLKPGERIIVEGLEKVKAGEKVAPIAVEAEPAGEGVSRAAAPAAPSPPPAPSADGSPAK